MSVSTRSTKLSILDHIFTVAELPEDEIPSTCRALGIASVDELISVELAEIKLLIDSGDLGQRCARIVKNIRQWCLAYMHSTNLRLPTTLSDWQELFTDEAYAEVIQQSFLSSATEFSPAPTNPSAANIVWTENPDHPIQDFQGDNSPITESQTTGIPSVENAKLPVKVSDFPKFKGGQDLWYSFREEFEAMAEISGMSCLVHITDKAQHQSALEDTHYKRQNTLLYSILKVKTIGGPGHQMIRKFERTSDGALAWIEIKAYYEQDGNRELYACKCLTELTRVKYDFNSPGGIDRCISDFMRTVDKMEDAGENVSEITKCTFFLQGIRDNRFAGIKDLAAGLPFQEIILRIRAKSIELNCSDKARSRDTRNLNYTSSNSNNNTRKFSGSGNRRDMNKNNKGRNMRFPSEIWNKMDSEIQEYIRLNQNAPSKSNVQGKQYGQRNANKKTKQESKKGTGNQEIRYF